MTQWNPAQLEAIQTRDKNILVCASAGSGKTTVLIARLMDLVVKDRISIDNILAMTFTEAAANEMKKRFDLIEKNKNKLGDEYKNFDYVSCQENGRPHSLSAFNIALGKICKKAGLPSVTVHGLRHMYATILIENGASLSKISALLGHSSINTTFEYYCDVSDEDHNIKAFIDNTFIPKGGI